MSELTEAVFRKSKIRSLTLSCGLTHIYFFFTSTMPELVELSLSGNYLTEIPKSFSLIFPNLQLLNISNNLLVDLPDNFVNSIQGNLVLDMSFNKLTHWRRLVANRITYIQYIFNTCSTIFQ